MPVRPSCPTRWTVHTESLSSIIVNYKVVQQLVEEILNEYRGVTEVTSVARGMLATVERFSILFCIFVFEHFFSITDTLS